MPGKLAHLEIVPRERNGLAFGQEAVRHAVAHRIRQAETLGLVLQIVEQRLVGHMRADDVDAERFLQFHRAAGMIDMPMRDPDRARAYCVVLQRLEHLVDIAARVDDDAALVVHVEQDGAVLLEGCDRHDAGIKLTHDRPFAISPPM